MRNIIFATLLLPLPLLAGEGEKKGPRDRAKAAIAERDTDGDGRLSIAEFGGGERVFSLLDRDGDGFVTAEELTPRRAPGPGGPPQGGPDPERLRRATEAILKRHDTDGDGRLSADELPPAGGRMDLSKADVNHDGFVDKMELTVALHGGGRGGPGARRGGDPAQMLKHLKRMDANEDGRIDRAEWKGREEMFSRIDADGDGAISKEELKKLASGWRARPGDALFRRADKDGDGKISREEWPSQPEFFARFDTNGDGFITADEVAQRGPRRQRYDTKSGKDSAHFLGKYDKDSDGRVTRDEFPHERRFGEIDTDKDGVLSKEEVEEAMDRRSAENAYGFLERFDLDGDGKVTREEFTGPARMFEARDRNHDGVIDKSDEK